MSSRRVEICNQRGLHARASAAFSRMANSFDAQITAKSIMDLLSLGASKGLEIHIAAEGPDADAAVAALSELVEARFGEDV